MIPVTVIILTYNEEVNIAKCLRSVEWSDDVIIVDSGSTDSTRASAEQTRAELRWFHHPFKDFGDQRNWALDHTSPQNTWILFLDADECVTPELAVSIQRVTSADAWENSPVGYFLCCKNYFLGRWIKRTTQFPSWQLRLLKSPHVRFRRMGHGQQEVTDGPLGYIREPYDHFALSKGIADWITKHNRYSTEEVEHQLLLRQEKVEWKSIWNGTPIARRRAIKSIAARLPFRPWIYFFYTYILRGGFLDGQAGLAYCLLKLTHSIHIQLKTNERLVDSTDQMNQRQP